MTAAGRRSRPVEIAALIPESVCILRLSALGDVCHIVPLVRAIQDQSPSTRITWIVGRIEARLVGDLEGVEFIVHDKRSGRAGWKALRAALGSRRFDALLLPQRSLRANLLSRLVRAGVRVGFDRARSKELHGWVIDRRIEAGPPGQHVLDAVLSFLPPIGLEVPESPRWDIPVSAEDRAFAEQHLPGTERTLLLSPATSFRERCWSAEGYALVLGRAVREHGFRAVLCGGRSELERELGDAILARVGVPVLDLIGKDTLKQLLAMLEKATLLVTPDSGPAHMATAMGTPVLGLHAATDCRRSGPYRSRDLCVNRFPEAARKFLGSDADSLPWGRHIHRPGVMELIEPTAVLDRLDAFASALPPRAPKS